MPFSIITASRLASEKHVDWIALAVIKARKALPELTFDIYGHGPEQEKNREDNPRTSCPRLYSVKRAREPSRCLSSLSTICCCFSKRRLRFDTNGSSRFGLGMIGFDVNYGSPTFIKDARNGYLIPINLIENPSTTSQITWRLRSSNILKMAPHTRTIYHTKLLRSLRQLI